MHAFDKSRVETSSSSSSVRSFRRLRQLLPRGNNVLSVLEIVITPTMPVPVNTGHAGPSNFDKGLWLQALGSREHG